jgi:hypothetical protein
MFVEALAIYDCSAENNKSEFYLFETKLNAEAFLQFYKLKTVVKCPFANNAKISDYMNWDQTLPFTSNLEKLLHNLKDFINKCQKSSLDGFVVTAPSSFSTSPRMLGEFLRRILFYLSDHDPYGSCFNEDINSKQWRYRFNSMNFFISAFSPCYSSFSSRSTHGIDQTIILFQPKISFKNGLSSVPEIKFSQHKYIRDKFCRTGKPYPLRDFEWQRFVFPASNEDKPIEWWRADNSFDFESITDNTSASKSMACVLM